MVSYVSYSVTLIIIMMIIIIIIMMIIIMMMMMIMMMMKIIINIRPYSRNTAHVERRNRCDISNNKGNCNHLKIIQKIPEQHIRKARNPGTTENSHIVHCTHTSESTNVNVQ